MADLVPKLGQTIETQDGRQGVVRYVGTLHIAAGNWLGLELADASGKNDGSVKGERYFNCPTGHGIFVRKESMVKILKQPTTNTAPRTNGSTTVSTTTTRPRPSSGITADVARKRQSLMSNGSGSAVGSRLSMRSPTKSPNKPLSTSASSATSTPRTGTPATTARTSDSSNKSRLSIGAKPSMAPPSSNGIRSSTHASRPSIGGPTAAKTMATARPSAHKTRPSLSGSRLSQQPRAPSRPDKPAIEKTTELVKTPESIPSPKIEEEGEEHRGNPNIEEVLDSLKDGLEEDMAANSESKPGAVPTAARSRTTSASRMVGVNNVESRAAQLREIEQLKAKIRTLEKNRDEDRDKLKQVETLQSDKDRFETIIQALQKKLRANQQELADLRNKCEQAEARANAAPERSPEHESEIELATLDKEMAEERAETYKMELDVLKAKHEELELEAEILREENQELASTMSPEEKASAGWIQMERERERLRDALIMLRDMTQQNEMDMKAEIAELQESLDEAEKTAGLYTETAEKLARAEETGRHLKEQLEAIETNDEVVEAMESQREHHLNSIEQLKHQIQDLEEHIQVTDELENFHVEEEKRLHAQLDETEALLSESYRRSLEQDRVIEDLEYTLTKFRDVVQGLQSDIDELRRSRNISELQASEMSSKSRAMMDLNLRLQSNAAKTQTKFIDTELNKVNAELASKHVEILNLFAPELFDAERKPVSALLCFGRVRYKAGLVGKILSERLRERSHLSSGEEVFRSFDTMERMEWISGICHRFEKFMSSCSTDEFAACSNALLELEPVERTVTAWIETLRKDELFNDQPEHLKRVQSILIDLSEKLITDTHESKATEMIVQMEMVETYADSLSGQLTTILQMVQSKLGPPRSEDEESFLFDKRMDQLVVKARTVKHLSSKVIQQLAGLCKSSLCLGETSWPLYEEAEREAESLTRQVRSLGLVVSEEIGNLDPEEPMTYASISRTITSALEQITPSNGYGDDEDAFMYLTAHLASLQSFVDDLQSRSGDLNSAVEFEYQPAPWIVRAKEIKNAKIVASETQQELNRLERRNLELGSKIAEREKTIEEMGMRVEIAEKRFKESRDKDSKDKALKEEVDRLKIEKEANDTAMAELRTELVNALESSEKTMTELETLRKAAVGGDVAAAVAGSVGSAGGKIDESIMKQFELEANLLQAEIVSLQAAIRYLREENRSLRIPVSEVLLNSARNSWLDVSLVKKKPTSEHIRKAELEREGVDVWSGLIDIAKNVRPMRLSSNGESTPTTRSGKTAPTKHLPVSRQPASQTTRYTILKQREELEHWDAWRQDFINRAKIVTSMRERETDRSGSARGLGGHTGSRTRKPKAYKGANGIPTQDGSNLIATAAGFEPAVGSGLGAVKRHLGAGGDDERVMIVE